MQGKVWGLGIGADVVFWSLLMFMCRFVGIIGMWVVGGQRVCVEVKVVDVSSEILDILIMLDIIRLRFVSLVFFISSCVLFYSLRYIRRDENRSRLVGLIVVFIMSIVMLIVFPSLLGLIIGWDGLGLSSFLLVVFYQNDNALASGIITAISNRIGDGLLISGIGACLGVGHWTRFFEIGGLIGGLIGLARITKRAQVPFCA